MTILSWLKKLFKAGPAPVNPLAPWSPKCPLCYNRMSWDGGIYYCMAYGHTPKNMHIDQAVRLNRRALRGKKS